MERNDQTRIAVMQPYLFPYIGYFQLIAAVDIFVSLDDVNFIKRGWINRNNIFVDGKASLFTAPLAGVSQNMPINKAELAPDFGKWREKFFRTLKQWYGREKHYEEGFELARDVLNYDGVDISGLNLRGIKLISGYLGLNTRFYAASRLEIPLTKGASRLAAIARSFGAKIYVNPPGGKKLYCEDMMTPFGIDLKFLKPCIRQYPMPVWIPALSILDLVMRLGFDGIKADYLHGWELERGARSFGA